MVQSKKQGKYMALLHAFHMLHNKIAVSTR